MSIQGLEKLEVWRKAKDFTLKVYREVLPILPPEEKWGMNQQIRRAVPSIPANIALNYIPNSLYLELAQNGEDLVLLINGYIAYLKRSRKGDKEIGASLIVKEQIEFDTPPNIENREDE